MRYFIGLDLSPADKLALENWRDKSLPEMPYNKPPAKSKQPERHLRPVPPANYHVTLCFLGSISPRQLEKTCQLLDDVTAAPFELTFDNTGYWSGPKIFHVAPSVIPEPLTHLASQTHSVARRAGIGVERREYRPHVTLIRNVKSDFPAPLFVPQLTCRFSQFHLFESVSGNSGVHYPIRCSWSLSAGNSVREKLLHGHF
ncbi:RNA 2',3'-cyclic phosphodiesterase [Alteromonas gilva]|uniref:RNA 2',3'-cyclic phosphodiesterase n=1 Tax=Alteromonas gilva TaxID=2987522 RepID=A0ABT5L4V6_9ALTE|nr:RNA 2',3'-cyclic phosphodiesterase [Alteromonas gilva]MDC8832081.1 RNA 2',3'-cyclic phosphodiesterase [Alteromonas gilva]